MACAGIGLASPAGAVIHLALAPRGFLGHDDGMSAQEPPQYEAGPHSPLQLDEVLIVQNVLTALRAQPQQADIADAIFDQVQSLDHFGATLARYPSPLVEQRLGQQRRGLETLVATLCSTDRTHLPLVAPTQAIVGRALTMAQINFFRLLWHGCGLIKDAKAAADLRNGTANLLRTSVYTRLVEEVLSELSTDPALDQQLRARAIRQLALLWAHRLTWRVSSFFPVLESTWEARARVRVVGGTLVGTTEIVQLITAGADARFVELLTERSHGEEALLAFREFLFGRSSEELDRLVDKMARQDLSSIELDSMVFRDVRDTGSVFYEFFQERFVQANARRLAGLPGPKHTAEGYVLLAWLRQMQE